MPSSRALVLSLWAGGACLLSASDAFVPNGGVASPLPPRRATTPALPMAGFGAPSETKKGKKKKGGSGPKLPKLRAKTQWDRYQGMKTCPSTTAGVRVSSATGGEGGEWLEVGRVRSADGENAVAVARQRALIAEHAKRLHPVRVPSDAVLEWGYVDGDGDDVEWTVVDKSAGDDAPKGVEKTIGFEGISDKATGYYCYYHEGRLVEQKEDSGGGAGFKAVKGK